MSENFTFHGQTTFINKPRETVIQDFQNAFITGNGSEKDDINQEVGKLVEIVLKSKDLHDEEKENIAQALHVLADQIKNEKANKITLIGTLNAIKEVVSKALDIASPAIVIITSIMKLLKIM